MTEVREDLHVAYDAPEELKERAWAAHLETAPGHIGTSVSEQWRDQATFDFSGCNHTARYYYELDAVRFDPNTGEQSVVGIWAVEICQECGTQVAHVCAHKINDWKFDGKLLVCRNCGSDGT